MTFGNRVLGSFCFALCCNHIIIPITILQDLLQIMKEIKVEDIAFAICSLSFHCFCQWNCRKKKQERKHLCNIKCAYSFGICFRVQHRSKNANKITFKISWNVLVLVFYMYCQRPGNIEGFIKTKVQSRACTTACPHTAH